MDHKKRPVYPVIFPPDGVALCTATTKKSIGESCGASFVKSLESEFSAEVFYYPKESRGSYKKENILLPNAAPDYKARDQHYDKFLWLTTDLLNACGKADPGHPVGNAPVRSSLSLTLLPSMRFN